MKTIVDLNNKLARDFFLRPRNYFSLALPSYYQFDGILAKAQELLREKRLADFYIRGCHPCTYNDVNYDIIYNKDGEYAWRRYQILHPFFYVEAVNLLTAAENWAYVAQRVKGCRNPKVVCTSMMLSPTPRLNRNEQDIFNWAGNFTNETVRQSLSYKYMLVTDMANCYDTLSFNLLTWALHGKNQDLTCNTDKPIVGYQLTRLLQDMLFGQSCGIPQGSVVMDFLAEVILCYIDKILYGKIMFITDVLVLRYRDDYRIFANDVSSARRVMKILVETLAKFNLKINLSKTFLTSNLVKYAFKPDRLAWKSISPLVFGENKLSVLKSLLLIQDFGEQYPNCGSLKHALGTLYKREICDAGCHSDFWQVVAVVIDIMYRNPGVWPHCIAILSKYAAGRDARTVAKIIEKIRQKFADMPHTEYLEIWLQRLSVKVDPCYQFTNALSKIVYDHDTRIWNSDWLGMYTSLRDSDMINYDEVLNMPPAVTPEEVALFVTNHGSG